MTEKDNTRSERLNNSRYTHLSQKVKNAKKRLQQVRDSNEDELEKED